MTGLLALSFLTVATTTASSHNVYTPPAVFERLSHFVDHGVPATLHDPLNQAMIADASCRATGGPFPGFAFYHDRKLVQRVISALSVLPSTASPSHFTLTATQTLPAICSASSPLSPPSTAYQCGSVQPVQHLSSNMDNWHRALCANSTDISWNGNYDPAYQSQQIALTSGFMCIVACDCAHSPLSADTLAAFATSDSMAKDVQHNVCQVLPYPSVNFTQQATTADELAKVAAPLRPLCGCAD